MAAPKKGPRRHLFINPYVYPDTSKRVDKALAWWDSLPSGERTKIAWELIVAAANGELGVAQAVMIGDQDAERDQAALESLLANMVMDED